MANRYWVGGTATWDTSTTTPWSTQSGGSGGASVPTASDSVFFDQPGTFTITGSGSIVCADITVSAGTYTFQTITPTISGNVTLTSNTVWGTAMVFGGTGSYTLTTNGATISGSLTCTTGATIGLGSALTLGQGIASWNNGSVLNTNGYALTLASITSLGTKTYNLGNSVVTLSGSGSMFNLSGTTTLTYSAGCLFNFTSASGNITVNSASLNVPAVNFTGSGIVTFVSSPRYENITCSYVGAKTFKFTAGTTTTFAGFGLSGSSGNLYTLTSTTTSAASIKKVGTWYMGANSVNSGNNSNLTFTAGGGIDYFDVSYITGVSVAESASGGFVAFFT